MDRFTKMIEDAIERGVEQRERKMLSQAHCIFWESFNTALGAGRYDLAVSALAQDAIIYQRRADEHEHINDTAWRLNLAFLKTEAEQIIDISSRHNLSSGQKANGFLRMGDYQLRREEYSLALENYRYAQNLLPDNEKRSARATEFAKNVTLARVLESQNSEWFVEFDRQIAIINNGTEYTPGQPLPEWHWLIIRSGILINSVHAGHALFGSTSLVVNRLRQARADAETLAKKFSKPLRLEEVERVERKYNLAA